MSLRTLFLVPGKGLEPLHLAAADFESAASTDSATPAGRGGHVQCVPPEANRRAFYPQTLRRQAMSLSHAT